MAITGGHLGYVIVNDTKVRFNSCDPDVTQSPIFYDHTIGMRDNIPTILFGGKGDFGYAGNQQKYLYRPSVIGYGANLSFPIQEGTESAFFNLAKTGDDFDFVCHYDCQISRELLRCKINTFTLNAKAGDVADISVNIVGRDANEDPSWSAYDESSKLITWDEFKLSGTSIDPVAALQSFTLNINNDCKPVYTANGLKPYDLRCGTQSVTGSMTFYLEGLELKDLIATDVNTLVISVGNLSFTVQCVYEPVKRTGAVGPILSTVNFAGVGSYFE